MIQKYCDENKKPAFIELTKQPSFFTIQRKEDFVHETIKIIRHGFLLKRCRDLGLMENSSSQTRQNIPGMVLAQVFSKENLDESGICD